MSDPEDFLSRWSRRKRDVAEESKSENTVSPEQNEGVRADDGDAASAADTPDARDRAAKPGALAGKSAELPFDIASLPSIESITATTDVRAFLAPGVPAELKRAALRRAFTVDPQIRDFVGLAENAWDFNAPNSIPGFGPLEMTDELRRIARAIVGSLPDSEPPDTAAASSQEVVAGAPDTRDASKIPASSSAPASPPAGRQLGIAEPLPAKKADESNKSSSAAPPAGHAVALQHRIEKHDDELVMVRRGHGGALPK
jgi:hypothetical protein